MVEYPSVGMISLVVRWLLGTGEGFLKGGSLCHQGMIFLQILIYFKKLESGGGLSVDRGRSRVRTKIYPL